MACKTKTLTHTISTGTSIMLSLVMLLLLSTFVVTPNMGSERMLIAGCTWALLLAAMTFVIYRTGRIARYRSWFFVIYAVAFVIVFITSLIEERGSMQLTQEIIEANETPMCPVAIPQILIPAAVQQKLIFPTPLVAGHYGGFWAILSMWVVGLLTMGRGWCSWGCFFGGLDDGFSRILRRPVVSTKKLDPRWRWFPFALLLVLVIWAWIAMEPVYCEWLCPFKMVTEYPALDTLVQYAQAIIFITLFMGLVVILPLLTKKRIQCGLFCPLGATNSLCHGVNPYRVTIDLQKCQDCGKCQRVCPTFSMTEQSRAAGNTCSTCTRCGACMDACPSGAIDYRLAGVPCHTHGEPLSARMFTTSPRWLRNVLSAPVKFCEETFAARTLFVFTAILFSAILSGSFVPAAAVCVFNWIF